MKRAEDISILITDKNFQRLLSEWGGFSEGEKAEVYLEYGLTAKDVEILRQLWLGLDFHSFEHPQTIIEEALEETIWKLAERKNTTSEKHPIKRLYEQFTRMAAILIIPIILYTAYIKFFNTNQNLPEATSHLVTVSSQAELQIWHCLTEVGFGLMRGVPFPTRTVLMVALGMCR